MKNMRGPRDMFRWSPMRWFGLNIGYAPEVVEKLKALGMAAWDRETKTWWFPEGLLPLVEATLQSEGQQLRDRLGGARPPPPKVPVQEAAIIALAPFRRNAPENPGPVPRWAYDTTDPWFLLGVRRDAPLSVINAAYWALRSEWFPPTGSGGTYEAYARLEAAYAAVKDPQRVELPAPQPEEI